MAENKDKTEIVYDAFISYSPKDIENEQIATQESRRVKAGGILNAASSQLSQDPTPGLLPLTELKDYPAPVNGVREARKFLQLPVTDSIIYEHKGRKKSIEFSFSCKRVVTVSSDKTARVWQVGWKELLSYLRSRTTACLAVSQRLRYLFEELEEAKENYEAGERMFGRVP